MNIAGAERLHDAIRIYTEGDHIQVVNVRKAMALVFAAGESFAIADHAAFKQGYHLGWNKIDKILFEEGR